ncbi:hypothetical protein [Burkholderia perseverans]|uniref:hypothetical protein n=1 Tax=Burkholderia perseverans TaxID=2615214 RepID=UPI001FEF0721|nr:hypothetical protein [Burkholderia perseverans]
MNDLSAVLVRQPARPVARLVTRATRGVMRGAPAGRRIAAAMPAARATAAALAARGHAAQADTGSRGGESTAGTRIRRELSLHRRRPHGAARFQVDRS